MNCLKHRVNIAVLVGIASFAFVICPLGFVNAQERDGADARVNRFKAYATEISKAVEAGDLSEEEAEKKLLAMRKRLAQQPAKKPAEGDKEARIRRFRAYAEEIQKAVDAGDLSEEEAEKKLLAMRKRLAQQPAKKPAEPDMDARVERYKAYVERIKKAVEAGELSEEEAEKKLIEMRQRMFGQPAKKPAEPDMEARIRRFRAYAEEIQKAVDAGDLSEEEAKEKLIEMRQRMFGQPAEKPTARDMEARVERYKAYVERIKKAVEAGELSEEEAEKKLIETRQRMFGQPAKKPAEPDMDARVERYKAYVEKIKKAVDAGDLSEDEAKEKLIETRLRLFPQPKQKK